MDLEAYRQTAESFLSELTGTFYRHYAGLEKSYEIEPIYERHAALFAREAVDALSERRAATSAGSEEERRLRMLLDFAVEGYIGQATKRLEAELAVREARGEIELGAQRIGFRESAVVQANEADAERREAIEQARLGLIAQQLDPLYRELFSARRECAAELGFDSYRALCRDCKGIDFAALQSQTRAFSEATESSYEPILEPELERTLGYGLSELRRADLPRFFRDADADLHFPASRLVPSLLETLSSLGIAERRGAIFDVEPRAGKSPRAFCAPVRVPEEVYLVIAPVGGRDDFGALFHEAGHTEHYAHVEPELPFEFRYLGDNSITEAFAFLLQHLVEDPVWLERRLGIEDPAPLLSYARAHRLAYLRRYAAKLAYELELHGADIDAPEQLYASLLGAALRVQWPTEMFLADVDPGFYCACYLRAWALETHLRAHLRESYGEAWFDSPNAGDELVALWREGQRRSPEELLAELTGGELDFGVLLVDLDLS